MANTKQNFLGLVKFKGTSSEYESQKALGKLIFAEVTGENAGKYIYANGLEYKVADSTNLDDLAQRVSTLETSMGELEEWKITVNSSIEILDASVEKLEERIADVSQDVINISTYVHETVDTSITDISTRLANVSILAADDSIGVNNSTIALAGDNYVSLTAANNTVTVAIKDEALVKGTKSVDASLATKGYVDDQISVLEQALVFIGDITSTTDASTQLTDKDVEAGYTYVATGAGEYDGQKFESGDLIIVKEDAPAKTTAKIIVVERNLDGAVTAGTPLDSSYLVVGTGDQSVKTINITAEELSTAIANANSAIQGVEAAAVQNSYVTISVEDSNDTSTIDVSAILTVVDTSAGLANVTATGSLVDAKAVKDFIDTQAADIKIQAILNSSTTDYVEASAFVDDSGRVISASVGVKTATLADASNGSIGLAMAKDVYDELTAVEETMTAANTTMANTIGLNPDNYSVTWSTASGISADTTIVAAIEKVKEVAEDAKQSGVTSFGDKTGAISIDGGATANGSVNFTMDGSTLTGTVVGWGDLTSSVSNNASAIEEVSTRVNEVSTRLVDLSTYVRKTVDASIDALQAKDVEIDASIDRLDASVSALESRTITGESGTLTNANDEYVNVSATTDDQGNVTIDSSVQLANPIEGETHADATGLATDGWVKDFLAWEVIE